MEKKLIYIKLIAQCGNINRAAEKLYITPSALSKFLSNVEQELNVKLFDRSGKRLILTYAGERYLYWIEKMQSIQANMKADFSNITTGKTGRLRIGIMLDDVSILTQEIFPRFYAEFPDVRVEVYEKQNKELRKMLEDHELDFAILHEYKVSDHCYKRALTPIYPVLVTSKANRLQQVARKQVGFPYPWLPYEALRNERFIVPFEEMDAYERFEEFCSECGFTPRVILQSQNVHLQASFLEKSNALLCSYDQLVKNNFNMSALQLFSYGVIKLPQYLILAYQKSHNLGEIETRMLQLCEECYGITSLEEC